MTSTQGHRLPAELVIAALLATALNVAAHFVQISSPLLRGRHSGRPAQAGSWRRGCQLRPQRRRRDPKQLRSPFGQPPVPRARHRNGRVPLALAVVGPMLEGRRPSPVVLVAALVVTCGAALVQGVGRSDGTGLAWAGVVLACEAGFTLLAVPVLRRHGPWGVSVHATWLAAAGFAVVAVAREGPGAVIELGVQDAFAPPTSRSRSPRSPSCCGTPPSGTSAPVARGCSPAWHPSPPP